MGRNGLGAWGGEGSLVDLRNLGQPGTYYIHLDLITPA